MRIFCVAEHRFDQLNQISLEILNLANKIKGKGTSEAVVIGKKVDAFAKELANYSDVVWKIEDESLENYNPELYIDVLMQLLSKEKADLILIGNTAYGSEFAPYLAVKMGVPIVTDVVGVNVVDGLKVTRYIFQGKLMVDLAVKTPCILTVRQGVFKESVNLNGKIIDSKIKPSKAAVRKFRKFIEPEVGEVDISKADVIVAVGRGIEDGANVPLAEELAKLLGGVVAGSRPVIDSGWLPKDRQVGISGKIVKPKLYLALGISGAFQHVMGMKDSELIIAINKDKSAPIFGVAHYGAIADIFEIVPELIDKLKKIKKS
ncbi:MAG: electron transfer flavoprotein subunit alpha/FixB family protein [Archaeoglobaceae archaeon]|nr:electron transfer flavoprotein subunit alpha/FixB family protein [Archaeoglobaceae archaeon]MCX8152596.1 electron transfer flavoprotein subunit alpha/FixB family protein [Archaeoglobaceae archaeon]MDW8014122.1 electron transfer flavoprotein subunit alpha/FixB family protein [Archaeoglobaceae archaeon]